MRFDYLYKEKGKVHSSARIYPESQKELCKKHAMQHKGKVRDRRTGKIIANFCGEKR